MEITKTFQILKGTGRGRSKYLNKKTVVDGITFDSIKESKRYGELKLLKQAKAIKDFQLQTEFVLFPKSRHFRKMIYKCDFRVEHLDGTVEIEDVKAFRTKEYKIKKILMWEIHGILIKEL